MGPATAKTGHCGRQRQDAGVPEHRPCAEGAALVADLALAEPAVLEQGALLQIDDLRVRFSTRRGAVQAVDGVSYSVNRGEIVALVGESGCGKSVSSLAIMGLLPPRVAQVSGRVMFGGRNLVGLPEDSMRAIRGREIAMIFQEPMTSLNPVLTIGLQVMEPLQIHLGMTDEAARARALELLTQVGITDAARRLEQHPHQLSGGMRQRVMIAMGLACNPKLLIADEPTTALDVTIQAQILELMRDISQRLGIALVIITHNLGVVARYADRVNVMYAGRQVEEGPAAPVFAVPRHPYTLGLLRSVPRLDRPREGQLATIAGLPPNLMALPPGCRFSPRCPFTIGRCAEQPPLVSHGPSQRSACWRGDELPGLAWPDEPALPEAEPLSQGTPHGAPLLEVNGLTKHFAIGAGRPPVRAVEDVSFTVAAGETLGLVGESGCGKSTVGRLLLALETPTAGEVRIGGNSLGAMGRGALRTLRRTVQVIFQDPYSSLNPRMTVGQIIAEPLLVHGIRRGRTAARARVAELLDQVTLHGTMAERYPHELSGGQRQRVGIARALAFEPRLIVCDEAVSALDVSVQGQVVNLLAELKRTHGLAYLFIAHDLAVVRHLSDRVAVMYLGRMAELGPADALYEAPLHPYTRTLLDAVPVPDPAVERTRPRRIPVGEPPSPLDPPSGCVFRTRCPHAIGLCAETVPPLRSFGAGRFAACHRVEEIAPLDFGS